MMNAIFSDNKIIDPNSTTQQVSLRNLPMAPQLPLRMSCSPLKMPTAKKFFFPGRNRSSKQDDNKSRIQLDNLLKKQKIMLLAQKSQFNELLFTPNMFLKESELLAFPSLEVKQVNYNEARKSKEKQPFSDLKLDDIHREYRSNILGSHSEVTSKGHQAKWVSQKRATPTEGYVESRIITKHVKKSSVSEVETRKVVKQERKFLPEPKSPVPLHHIKSLGQIEPGEESPVKKYKRGYLWYHPGGQQFWERVSCSIQRPALIKGTCKTVTAKTYLCLNLNTLEPLLSNLADNQIQIASVTKIMTCYLTILIARKYEVDLKEVNFRVPDWIADTPGTSAQLEAGDTLSAYDLLFALMLPSGNDAALCLAELMGKIIQRHRKKDQKRSFHDTFLAHMNLFSKELNLPQEWGNPHGLSACPNTSTAKAIAALSALALKDETFRKVINTREHQISIKNDRYGLSNRRTWKNTNKLLQKQGWQGVKTGTTDSAGHCLMALRDNMLLGVFDCQTLSKRFSDAVRLSDYILSHKDYA